MEMNDPDAGATAGGERAPPDERPVDLSNHAHQQLIGYLGLLLPVLLIVLTAMRPIAGQPTWMPWGSVSAYYYSGAVGVFVGVLFALSLFLLTYQGYSQSWADRALGRIGGVCAICVAVFPTGAPVGLDAPVWWTETVTRIHYISAALLFVVFILFSLWLFRRSDVPVGHPLPPEKKGRNRVFLICGIVMVVCVLWAGSSMFTGSPIFIPEAIALWAFAFSWLVKGRARRTLMQAVRRVTT